MDGIDLILNDWRACRPEGVIVRASPERLDAILVHCHNLIQDSTTVSASKYRRQARAMLSDCGEAARAPPLISRLLAHSSGDEGSQLGQVVHFLHFWQVLGDFRSRLHRIDATPPTDGEPLATELACFRDVLLTHDEEGSLTLASFLEALAAARKASHDVVPWLSLQKGATLFAELEVQQNPGALTAPVQLEKVSALIFGWLSDLVEEYCRGQRAARIRAVRDVLGCSAAVASEHLGKTGWDIESALRHRYSNSEPGNTLVAIGACKPDGWSSKHAQLRSTTERECQICVAHFTQGAEPIVTKCCFQVLCVHCVGRLSNDSGQLRCPFCRANAEPPVQPRRQPRRRPAQPQRAQPPLPVVLQEQQATQAELANHLAGMLQAATDMVSFVRGENDAMIEDRRRLVAI